MVFGLGRIVATTALTITFLSSTGFCQADEIDILSQIDQQMNGRFPMGPRPEVTTGTLCDSPDSYRYDEKIPYCDRHVEPSTKGDIIKTYDKDFGYKIESMNRQDFKIDHLIPLCAGGGNQVQNLWPQHKSVYAVTDPLEPEICAKMAAGHLKQKDAVNIIIFAKQHLDQVSAIMDRVKAL